MVEDSTVEARCGMNIESAHAHLKDARTALQDRIDAPWDDDGNAEVAAWTVVDDMSDLLAALGTVLHGSTVANVERSIADWLDAQGLRHETDVAAGNVPEEHYDSKLNRANAYRDAAQAIRSGAWSA